MLLKGLIIITFFHILPECTCTFVVDYGQNIKDHVLLKLNQEIYDVLYSNEYSYWYHKLSSYLQHLQWAKKSHSQSYVWWRCCWKGWQQFYYPDHENFFDLDLRVLNSQGEIWPSIWNCSGQNKYITVLKHLFW